MTDAGVVARADGWVRRYVAAWESNDAAEIRALFTADAEYRTSPFREPHVGRDAIAEMWLDRLDEPGTFCFDFRTIATDGDRAFVEGVTRYTPSARSPEAIDYANLWVIEVTDDGSARAFTEWWMPIEPGED